MTYTISAVQLLNYYQDRLTTKVEQLLTFNQIRSDAHQLHVSTAYFITILEHPHWDFTKLLEFLDNRKQKASNVRLVVTAKDCCLEHVLVLKSIYSNVSLYSSVKG